MTPHGLWLLILIDLGAIAALTTVALTVLLSQTRIFFAMASDGLLPKVFARISSHTKTPWISIAISGNINPKLLFEMSSSVFLGVFCAIISGVCPVDILGGTASISALITYLFVHIEVIVVSVTDVFLSDSTERCFVDALYTSRYATSISSSIRFMVCSDSGFITLYTVDDQYIEGNSIPISCVDRHWSDYLFFLWFSAFEWKIVSTAGTFD